MVSRVKTPQVATSVVINGKSNTDQLKNGKYMFLFEHTKNKNEKRLNGKVVCERTCQKIPKRCMAITVE